MIDPKAEFLKEPEAKEFADMVARKSFKKGCAYALAQLAMTLPANSNPFVLDGARLLLSTLEYIVAPEPNRQLPSRALKPT